MSSTFISLLKAIALKNTFTIKKPQQILLVDIHTLIGVSMLSSLNNESHRMMWSDVCWNVQVKDQPTITESEELISIRSWAKIDAN